MKKILLPVLVAIFLTLMTEPIGATNNKASDADVDKRFKAIELQMQEQKKCLISKANKTNRC